MDFGFDEREDIQKKTQTKWINSMLAKGNHSPVKDLFTDLRDGTRLLSLLEVLTNKIYKRERGRMRVHHLNNVSRALEVLKENNVRLVNISNNDIVDGNGKITLALSWAVFLHWQVNDIMKHLMNSTHQSSLEKALLQWCQVNTEPYPGVDIKNFSTSWSDGLAFAAIIHRWRPELMDFAAIAAKDPNVRLDAVFEIAYKELGIERLLDPEDVNVAIPDKKSVMMYVMCLFQSLAQAGHEPPPLPNKAELEEEIKLEVAKLNVPSVELTSYQNIVEELLSWLLIADDRLSSMEEISSDLAEVKVQFQGHEKFLLTLTDHQENVGAVLHEGTRLLQDAKISPHELDEVRIQMKLLNTKWEEVRIKAMERQTKIHDQLNNLQTAELESLKDFLTKTEDRISRMGTVELKNIEEQIAWESELQADIVRMQERVMDFSNLVVVVESGGEKIQGEGDITSMEDQLQALSERWTHVCNWTEKRGELLQTIVRVLPEYNSRVSEIGNWLESVERELREVECNPDDSQQEGSSVLGRYEKLKLLQSSMERKRTEINDLQELMVPLSEQLPEVESRVEEIGDKLDALCGIIEAQASRIGKKGSSAASVSADVEMLDILKLVEDSSPARKRSKQSPPHTSKTPELTNWVLRTESLLKSADAICTFDELSVDEQLILWEDLNSEMLEFGNVGENNEDFARVKALMDERKHLIDGLVVEKEVEDELKGLEAVLAAYSSFIASLANPTHQPKKSMEQIRIKLKTIQSQEAKLEKLRVKSAAMAPAVDEFRTRWRGVIERLQSHLDNLVQHSRMTEEEKEQESQTAIRAWISSVGDQVDKKSDGELTQLISDAEIHLLSLKGLHDSTELEAEFTVKLNALKKRHEEISQASAKFQTWNEDASGLESWLEEVDVFVCAEGPGIGDPDILDAQLEQSNALLVDIEQLAAKYSKIAEVGQELIKSGSQQLRARVLKLNSHWKDTIQRAKVQNDVLKDALEKTKQVLRSLDETSEWLTQLNRDAPKLTTVTTPSELSRLTRKYAALKDRVDRREPSFRLLNDRGNELLLMHQNFNDSATPPKSNIQELAKALTSINSRWTEATTAVDRNSRLLRDCSNSYGEFRSLLAQENDWLDRLEKKLNRVRENADLEEISEDLDEMEQYTSESQRLSKLQAISNELSHNSVFRLDDEDVKMVTKRWNELNERAQLRRIALEQELDIAESWERSFEDISSRIAAIDGVLNAWFELEQVEVDQLTTELEDQLRVLDEMRDQIAVYRKAGKIEGAERLEQQTELLQQRYDQVKAKFSDLSESSESDLLTRLQRVRRNLKQVEQALCFLELASDDPESIRRQLEHCGKEYGTLRSLKPELESVLKEGRKVTTPKMTEELDGVKGLYNRLGLQIATIRSNLEKGLTVTTELHECLNSLEEWVGNATSPTQHDLEDIRPLTSDLNHTQNTLSTMEKNYAELIKVLDPVLLDALVERKAKLSKKVNEVMAETVSKHESFLGTSDPEELRSTREKLLSELDSWVVEAEEKLRQGFDIESVSALLRDMAEKIKELRNVSTDLSVLDKTYYKIDNELERLEGKFECVRIGVETLSSYMLDDDEIDESGDQGISNYAYDSSSGDDLQNTNNTSQALDSDEDTFSTVVTAPGLARSKAKEESAPQKALPAQPVVVADDDQFVKLKDIQQVRPDLEVPSSDPYSFKNIKNPQAEKYLKTNTEVLLSLADLKRRSDAGEVVDINPLELSLPLAISSGDSLSFQISKSSLDDAQTLQKSLDAVRRDWQHLKSRVGVEKAHELRELTNMARAELEATRQAVEKAVVELPKESSPPPPPLPAKKSISGESKSPPVKPPKIAPKKGIPVRVKKPELAEVVELIDDVKKEVIGKSPTATAKKTYVAAVEPVKPTKPPLAKKEEVVKTQAVLVQKHEVGTETEPMLLKENIVEPMATPVKKVELSPDPHVISVVALKQEVAVQATPPVKKLEQREMSPEVRPYLIRSDSREMSPNRSWWEPQTMLKDWITNAKNCLDTKAGSMDETALRDLISELKSLEHTAHGKKSELEKVRQRKLLSYAEISECESDINQLTQVLPIQRAEAEQKLARIRKLTNHLDNVASWVLEVRASLASAKHRPDTERIGVVKRVVERSQEKEAEVLTAIHNFNQGDEDIPPVIQEKVRQLKEDWIYVLSCGDRAVLRDSDEEYFKFKGRPLTPTPIVASTSVVAPSTVVAQAPVVVTPAPIEASVTTVAPIESPKKAVMVATSASSVSDGSTSADIDLTLLEMSLSLKQLKPQIVAIGDVSDVEGVLEKQKTVLRELELKKPQLDELMVSAENLKSDTQREALHAKVSQLKAHWHETNVAVLARKSELESCLRDSISFQADRASLEKMFTGPSSVLKLKKLLDQFMNSAEVLIQRYPGDGSEYVKSVMADMSKYYQELVTREARLLEQMEQRGSEVLKTELEEHAMTVKELAGIGEVVQIREMERRVDRMRALVMEAHSQLQLREVLEYVLSKGVELEQFYPVAPDLPMVQKQIAAYHNFRQSLEYKRPLIETTMSAGGSPAMRRDCGKLADAWTSLLTRTNEWGDELGKAAEVLQTFQQALDDSSARLATAEAIKSHWPAITSSNKAQIDQLKTWREHINATTDCINNLNAQMAKLPHVSEMNRRRVEELNTRVKNLKQNVEAEHGIGVIMGVGGGRSLEDHWERGLIGGVPYYIDHRTETTQWDHPVMAALLDSMTQFNNVRFSAYRTALKLHALQKELKLHTLPLASLIKTLDALGLRGNNDRVLDTPDMISTLTSIYSQEENVNLLTDLAVNYIVNCFDTGRSGGVRNLSFKIGLVLLCRGSLEEKFKYLFRLIADGSGRVDSRKLGLLLHDCMQLPRQLGEVAAFGGSNIEPSVRSCFELAGNTPTIDSAAFIAWVRQEPQSLVWLPVLHRVAAGESAIHQAKCNVCKTVPIHGLRYRCLKCFNFDMCQECFFSGKKCKNHKLTHPMQEYCTEATSGEEVRDFTRALKNRFKSKRSLAKNRKLGYLPVSSLLEGVSLESPAPSPQHSLTPDLRFVDTPESDDEHSLIAAYCHSMSNRQLHTSHPRSPVQIIQDLDSQQQIQLESVLRSLEAENGALLNEYETLRSAASQNNNVVEEARILKKHKGRLEGRMSLLQEHNAELEGQLWRLRGMIEGGGTLGSKAVVASELISDPTTGSKTQPYPSPPPIRPPPTPSYQLAGSNPHHELHSRGREIGRAVEDLVATVTDDDEE